MGAVSGTPETITYSYDDEDWGDLLTAYNGEAITYDEIGNPLTYRSGMQFQWEGGRKLTSFSTPNAVGNYVYNADGIRVYKEVNGNTTEYYLNGTQIETEITNFGGVTRRVDYIYDENGSIYGFVVDNTNKYYYTKNLQGDVIGILDSTGTQIVEYSYDAWGKATVSYPNADSLTKAQKQANYFLGSNNPFRYRGYYFDNETGFYYLNSRYYDPEVGRFINADDSAYLGASGTVLGYNLFTYCYNSSVNFADLAGTSPIQVVLAALFGVIGFAIADCIARGLGLFPSGKGFWNATMYWALTGAIAVGGVAIGWFAGAAITKIVVTYISKSPSIIIRIANKCGGSLFTTIMYFLGINPFNYVSNASQLTALARALNSSWFSLPKAWAQAFCNLADKMGRKLFFDVPHGRYGYHIHLGGQNGQRLENLHFQVTKSVWEFLKKLFG